MTRLTGRWGRRPLSAVWLCSNMFMGWMLVAPAPGHAQELLRSPQKIVIDAPHDRLLVSNFGGGGSLVQIAADGHQEYFVQNAGCVDGLAIADGVVYGVGNNRRLYGYDLETGEKVLDIRFDGASSNYLSSVASDSEGHLYISCPRENTIFKFDISAATYEVFAQDDGLNLPNGICVEHDNNRLVVIDDSPPPSMIHAVSLADAAVTDLLTTDFRNPDGIVRDVNGTYYVGGYYLPALYRIDQSFTQDPEMLFEGEHMVYPTYDERDHSLLITYYGAHSWGRVLLPAGVLDGTVSAPLPASLEQVEISIGNLHFHPDSEGHVGRRIPVGRYDVTASLVGFGSVTLEDVEFVEDQVTQLELELLAPTSYRVGARRRFGP